MSKSSLCHSKALKLNGYSNLIDMLLVVVDLIDLLYMFHLELPSMVHIDGV